MSACRPWSSLTCAGVKEGQHMRRLRRIAVLLLLTAAWGVLVAILVAVTPDTSNEVIMAPEPSTERRTRPGASGSP